jgi:hypothetical protein
LGVDPEAVGVSRRTVSPIQLVLLILLAGLVALLLKNRGAEEPPGEGGPPGIPAFPTAEVQEILFRRGATNVRVVREADGFWIVEPYRDRASEEMIAQSLKVASTLSPLRVLPDTAGASFGLAPPSAVWSCRWAGGRFAIELGDSIPAGGGRYARRSGSPKLLIVDPFLARRFLTPPVQDVHSMIACPVGVGPVDTVRIETREEKLVIVRRRAESWEIVEPIRAEASAGEIARAVQNLRMTTMTQVLGPVDRFDLPALGLEPPRAVWTLVQGSTRMTARIGHPTPDQRNVHLIPAGRQVVGWIGSESFRAWVDGSSRLRETRMLWAAADSVQWVSVRKAGAGREFVMDPRRGWCEIAGAETLVVRQDAFSQAIQNLCAVRAVSFDAPGGPIGEPTLSLRLGLPGGRVDSLSLGPPMGGSGAARGTRQPAPCLVSGAPYRTWSLWLGRPLRP